MNYLMPFISLLNEMSPYLLLGFLIAGVLKVYVPKKLYINKLAKPTLTSAIWSAVAGVPLPLCSCGVIPTGMALHKEGASKGATVSFLISTPQTGVDSIAATYSLLGLPFAIIRPIIAFVTGILGGFITNKLDKNEKKPVVENEETTDTQIKNKLLRVLHYGFVEMIQDIGKWLIIGIIGAGLIALFVPDSLFSTYLSNPILNMFIVLLISVPMYTCSTGSIPLAAVLMMKGLSPGAALVMLMAGPATSIASISVVGKILGKKTLAIYLASIIIGAMTFGLLIDFVLPASWFSMEMMNHEALHGNHHSDLSLFKTTTSIILIALIINAFFQKHKHSSTLKKQAGMSTIYHINGMTCNHCKITVEKNLSKIPGITSVQVDIEKSIAYVEGKTTDSEIQKTVETLGYEYKGKSNE